MRVNLFVTAESVPAEALRHESPWLGDHVIVHRSSSTTSPTGNRGKVDM
jgi:hypothetical protein